MCKSHSRPAASPWWMMLTLMLVCAHAVAYAQGKFPGIGRAATPDEVAAWDIDVRPDFQGLPRGQGTVDEGADIWERACAACHGAFGESNEVFTPLVGGTTPDDVESGRVAALRLGSNQPQRTSLMKVSTVSTLWDYIYRAMPWDAPKSLSPDEVYAVVAYLLNLGEIVPADFTLSYDNIAEVKMPNRNGVTTEHGMWRVDGKPDTANTACMQNCVDKVEISSVLPDYARNAHGDIATQNRVIGPVRGVNTLEPPLTGSVVDNAEAVRAHAWATMTQSADGEGAGGDLTAGLRLVSGATCVACHAVDRKLVGPGYREIAGKYQGQDDARKLLFEKIRNGGAGVWGTIPMPPNPTVSDEDLETMVGWILSGAPSQ